MQNLRPNALLRQVKSSESILFFANGINMLDAHFPLSLLLRDILTSFSPPSRLLDKYLLRQFNILSVSRYPPPFLLFQKIPATD
jgi:hypothetical protein